MISSKHITKIAAALMSVVIILCILALVFSNELFSATSDTAYSLEYENELFNTEKILNIDIVMDEDSWSEMLTQAMEEKYYKCDVIINNTTFHSVGIRPKGNTSLSSIASDPDNDRYSFKLEFDHYVDGQTCFGLDKLALNNNYADITNMKEAVVYDMYRYMGADASLYNYAKISVNGNYWGVYLALEAVEDSFMLRNFGAQNGKLYKPDGMNMGDKNNKADNEMAPPDGDANRRFPNNGTMPNMENIPADANQNNSNIPPDTMGAPPVQNGEAPDMTEPSEGASFRMGEGAVPNMGGRGGPSGGGGANLNYTDDELDSYSTIWDGAISNTTDADHKRVVTALKNVNQGANLEKYLDIDNVLKYMAVHSFAVNDDSLSGNMAHNYYLYESDGKLNILPWDYNLSFGGMHSDNASDVINDPIDTPFSATQFFDALLENEKYLEKYHSYYNQLVEGYVSSGRFEQTYNRIRMQIDELVKIDPNAMYSYEEYTLASQMIYDTVMLRADSVKGQLDGTIPSTSEQQRANPDALIDASSIDVSVMAEFRGGGDSRHGAQGANRVPEGEVSESQENNRGVNAPALPNDSGTDEGNTSRSRTFAPGANIHEPPNSVQTSADAQVLSMSQFIKEYQSALISILLLAIAFVVVVLYKRKMY